MEYKDLSSSTLDNYVDYDEHVRVRRVQNEETGLIGYIAVHNTNLGPALGGCRVSAYKSEDEAIRDALRLSRGMTYKNALAGLPLGGGKSVIIADPYTQKTPEMITDVARAVEALGGEYISAEDSGLSEDDVRIMAKETDYVVGFSTDESEIGGNPSPVTAYGVFCGMRSAVLKRYGKTNMDGLKVSIQGLGAVGYELARLLQEDGAKIFACDMREAVLEQAQKEIPGLEVVALDDIFDCDADIFAPCAMGAQLNSNTIPRLKVDMVVGAANNQLATQADEQLLEEKNILYAPDYVVNSGGVIAVAYEYFDRIGQNPFPHEINHENMMAHVERSARNVEKIFDYAEKMGISTGLAANQMAEKIFLRLQSEAAGQSDVNQEYHSIDQQDACKIASR